MNGTELTHRSLALDRSTGRVGEVMDIAREFDIPVSISLRPVGGGKEWSADPDDVELVQADAKQEPS